MNFCLLPLLFGTLAIVSWFSELSMAARLSQICHIPPYVIAHDFLHHLLKGHFGPCYMMTLKYILYPFPEQSVISLRRLSATSQRKGSLLGKERGHSYFIPWRQVCVGPPKRIPLSFQRGPARPPSELVPASLILLSPSRSESALSRLFSAGRGAQLESVLGFGFFLKGV